MSRRHKEAWSQTWEGGARGCNAAAQPSELSSFLLHSVHLLPSPLSLQPCARQPNTAAQEAQRPISEFHGEESDGSSLSQVCTALPVSCG